MPRPRPDLAARVAAAERAAEHSGDVISRDLLAGLGVDDQVVRRLVKARRWRIHGHQTVAVHCGPLSGAGMRWRAIWEVGAEVAALDGVTALQVAGLQHFADDLVHVSVKHNANVVRPDGVALHKVIRRVPDEVVGAGLPRTRPAVAAIRAAHWARSARQAALVMVMPVQQRIVTGQQLVEASRAVRGRNRRALVGQLARDIADGAHSLGELDFAGMCRRRGLPEPDRQVVRRGPRGRVYLDVGWRECGWGVEIDGAGHRVGLAVTDDNLRQNAVVIEGTRLLRIDLLGLRVAPEAFLDQVCQVIRRR